MPTLNWIGKDKVVNHHLDVPFRVMEHRYGFTQQGEQQEPVNSGNKIIHGDNLEALKALLPEYEGKIKCIYIDPPYNTGNEKWRYIDNVNDARLQKWFQQIVGPEGDDMSRHDKWLCMMYPRLKLLHRLLHNEGGMIFVSIDDNELAPLKLIMDEIFGRANFIEYFSWVKTSTPPSLAKKSRKTVEYVLCYEKRRTSSKYKAEEGDGGDAPLINSGNTRIELVFPKENIRFKLDDGLYPKGDYERVTLLDDLSVVNGQAQTDVRLLGEFKWTQATLENEIEEGTSFVVKSESFSVRYLREGETYKAPTNLLKEKYLSSVLNKTETAVDTNETAKKELLKIFGKHVFDYPKPVSLIQFFIRFMEDKNGIVLDSFAGSGTTGHAVLNQNKADGGNRKFILIQVDESDKKGDAVNIAETVTATRIKAAITGFADVPSTGGSFDFFELGDTLFTATGEVNELAGIESLRRYVWYTETRTPYARPDSTNEYLLGVHNDVTYYFYYDPDGETILNYKFLTTLDPSFRSPLHVVFADSCALAADLMQEKRIVFKKIPRDITKF